ncbi:MAG: nucleotidyltransferase family protein [Bacteroidales bacterium]|nr:nucleotidyltransferase family protein [Bacteroidales bacterium]
MSKVAELIHLSRVFKENDLTLIPIKGPILSWKLHQDFLFRSSSDLDVLVDLNDLERSIELIKDEGYKPIYFDIPKTKNKKALVLKINNQIAFFHPKKKSRLEIHWRLIKYPIIPQNEFNQLLNNNLDSIVVHGETFTVLNKEFEFVYLILHGALHTWGRLKWLHDIYAYLKDEDLDWNKIFILSDHLKSRHFVFQALILADKYWNTNKMVKKINLPQQENIHKFIIDYPVKRINSDYKPSGLIKKGRHIYKNTKYSLLLFSELNYRMSFIRRLFFDEREMDMIALPDSLAFLYFIFRPFSFIYRKTFIKP